MKNLIIKHKLPAIEKATHQINKLEDVVESYKISDEIRLLDSQFKVHENYKISCQSKTEIAIIEADKSIALGNIEIEQNKQKIILNQQNIINNAIINGYSVKEIEKLLNMALPSSPSPIPTPIKKTKPTIIKL